VRDPLPLSRAVMLRPSSEKSHRCRDDARADDIRSRSRRHSGHNHQALASEIGKCSQLAQCGTSIGVGDPAHRGERSAWVRNTPTGVPDCTSSVLIAFETF